ncbi:MAG: hypothetical protein Cons2KO_10090 [Congregibacter sp.]
MLMIARSAVILIAVMLATLTAAFAFADEDYESLVRKYIATLDRDRSAEVSFYTDQTRFRDPTSDLFGPAWDITGGEAIVSFFEQAAKESGTLTVDYRVTNILVEQSRVVANITSTVTSCGVGLGFPEKVFSGDIELVMVLRFEDQKVLERTDYVGYSAAFAKLEQITKQLADETDDPRCGR